jgi:hypothetical protein
VQCPLLIERLGLTLPVAEIAVNAGGLLQNPGRTRVITRQIPHDPEVVEGVRLAERRFAAALAIPPHLFGLAARAPRHGHLASVPGALSCGLSSTVAVQGGREDGDDPVRRRQLLAGLALTAAGAATTQGTGSGPAPAASGEPGAGDRLISRVRDAMLGLAPGTPGASAGQLRGGLAAAQADFRRCSYSRLADRLPRLICADHALAAGSGTAATSTLLADIYTLATRTLIKLDDQQLGWLAADRAQALAAAGGDPLVSAEAARNLAVLARKAGWHA